MIPPELLSSELPSGAKVVAVAIATGAGPWTRTGLAAAAGVHRNSIPKAIAALAQAGWLSMSKIDRGLYDYALHKKCVEVHKNCAEVHTDCAQVHKNCADEALMHKKCAEVHKNCATDPEHEPASRARVRADLVKLNNNSLRVMLSSGGSESPPLQQTDSLAEPRECVEKVLSNNTSIDPSEHQSASERPSEGPNAIVPLRAVADEESARIPLRSLAVLEPLYSGEVQADGGDELTVAESESMEGREWLLEWADGRTLPVIPEWLRHRGGITEVARYVFAYIGERRAVYGVDQILDCFGLRPVHRAEIDEALVELLNLRVVGVKRGADGEAIFYITK